ncbi:MAG: hypothetical protein AAFQ65_11315 [Myxococcota bacterium]
MVATHWCSGPEEFSEAMAVARELDTELENLDPSGIQSRYFVDLVSIEQLTGRLTDLREKT